MRLLAIALGVVGPILAQGTYGHGPVSWSHYDQASGTITKSGYNSILYLNGKTRLYQKDNGVTIYSNALYSFASANTLTKIGTSGTTVESCTDHKAWQASTVYTTSGTASILTDPNGHLQRVTTGGTSGGSQPTWNTTGGNTTDGTVIWHDQGIWPPDRHPIGQWWADPNHNRLYIVAGICGKDPESGSLFNLWYINPDTESQWHAVTTAHTIPVLIVDDFWDQGANFFDYDDNIDVQYGGDSANSPQVLVFCTTDLNPIAGTLTANQVLAGCGTLSSATTLSAALTDTTGTAVSVTSGAAIVNGSYIQIGSELLRVDSGAGTSSLTCARGALGSTAATHTNGSTVSNLTGDDWVKITTSGGPPAARAFMKGAYIGFAKGIFGGGANAAAAGAAGKNETWQYDVIGKAWTRLNDGTANAPPPVPYTHSPATTTLSAAISSTSATSISVTSGTSFADADYFTIDSETFQVKSGGGTSTLTVRRGAIGTTAATHSNGATVTTLNFGMASFPAMDFNPNNRLLYWWDNIGGEMWTMNPFTSRKWINEGTSAGPVASTNGTALADTMVYDGACNCIVLAALTNSTSNALTMWVGQLPTIVNGMGASTLSCIDLDGDGYGVGESCTGPDADDQDAAVHSYAQALSKWGTHDIFLSHLGYDPVTTWWLAPSTASPAGSDSNDCHTISTPCLTYAHISVSVVAGHVVILRDGYNDRLTPNSGSIAAGPVVIMSLPGEQAVLNKLGSGGVAGATVVTLDISWLVVDGIKTHYDACIKGGTTDGQASSTYHDNIFRHIEATGKTQYPNNCTWGISAFNGLVRDTWEYNSLHDTSTGAEHGMYIGGRTGEPEGNFVWVRRNLFYSDTRCGMQWNGVGRKILIEQNISYSNELSGLCADSGMQESVIRTNLLFNNVKQSIIFNNYDPGGGFTCPPYCAANQTHNLIQNNTMYATGNGAASDFPALYFANTRTDSAGDLGYNTIRNNIIVDYGHNNNVSPTQYSDATGCGSPCLSYMSTSAQGSNIYFQSDGLGGTGVLSFSSLNKTCSQAASFTTMTNCVDANPLFSSASITYWNSVAFFSFKLQPSSPAYHAGVVTGTPQFDLYGNTYASVPSIGAIDALGVGGAAGSISGGKGVAGGKAVGN